jgi:hypothetical protein
MEVMVAPVHMLELISNSEPYDIVHLLSEPPRQCIHHEWHAIAEISGAQHKGDTLSSAAFHSFALAGSSCHHSTAHGGTAFSYGR